MTKFRDFGGAMRFFLSDHCTWITAPANDNFPITLSKTHRYYGQNMVSKRMVARSGKFWTKLEAFSKILEGNGFDYNMLSGFMRDCSIRYGWNEEIGKARSCLARNNWGVLAQTRIMKKNVLMRRKQYFRKRWKIRKISFANIRLR